MPAYFWSLGAKISDVLPGGRPGKKSKVGKGFHKKKAR